MERLLRANGRARIETGRGRRAAARPHRSRVVRGAGRRHHPAHAGCRAHAGLRSLRKELGTEGTRRRTRLAFDASARRELYRAFARGTGRDSTATSQAVVPVVHAVAPADRHGAIVARDGADFALPLHGVAGRLRAKRDRTAVGLVEAWAADAAVRRLVLGDDDVLDAAPDERPRGTQEPRDRCERDSRAHGEFAQAVTPASGMHRPTIAAGRTSHGSSTVLALPNRSISV
jgi:hypothetical protein